VKAGGIDLKSSTLLSERCDTPRADELPGLSANGALLSNKWFTQVAESAAIRSAALS
jgi:hypothetical protein